MKITCLRASVEQTLPHSSHVTVVGMILVGGLNEGFVDTSLTGECKLGFEGMALGERFAK